MNRKFLIIVAAMTLGFAMPGMAATSTFDIDAEVRAAISIGAITNLDFGIIESPGGATTITVNAVTGTQSGAIFGGALAGTSAVTAQTGAAFLASVSPATVTVGDGAAATMTVDTFVVFCSTCTAGNTLFTAGPDSFFIGADLNIGAGQTAGTYSATAGNGSGVATLTIVYQ